MLKFFNTIDYVYTSIALFKYNVRLFLGHALYGHNKNSEICYGVQYIILQVLP